jgi:hypothetical protein
MNHKETRTHMIHHNSNLGEPTTFPLIVYFVLGHETNTQMSFCHFEILKIRTHMILEAHNFVCKLSIEVKFEANL